MLEAAPFLEFVAQCADKKAFAHAWFSADVHHLPLVNQLMHRIELSLSLKYFLNWAADPKVNASINIRWLARLEIEPIVKAFLTVSVQLKFWPLFAHIVVFVDLYLFHRFVKRLTNAFLIDQNGRVEELSEHLRRDIGDGARWADNVRETSLVKGLAELERETSGQENTLCIDDDVL